MTSMTTVVSRNLRMLLAIHHMTQVRLAEMTYMSTSAINDYVLGKQLPPLEVAATIADIFGVTVDWLCGRDTSPEFSKNPNNNVFEEE